MRIAIDIDGVLCDHVAGLIPRILERYGVVLTKSSVTTWDHNFGPSNVVDELKDAYTDEEFVLGLPPIWGAREGIARLSRDHEIVVVTARSQETRVATDKWISRHIGNYQPQYVFGSKLTSLGDVLVDDFPGNVSEFVTAGRRAIIFDQPWNRTEDLARSDLLTRAMGWLDVVHQADEIHASGTLPASPRDARID